MVLWDNPASSNGLKVRIMLAETGTTARIEDVPLTDERPAAYLGLHPFGTVPCLVHGDLAIVESHAILRYLAALAGRDDLYPAEPAARARQDMLLDALSLAVRPALWGMEEPLVYGLALPDGELGARRAALRVALGAWERLLAVEDRRLAPYGLADIAMAGRLVHLERLDDDPGAHPVTWRRMAAARARPAYREAVAGTPFDRSG